MGRWYLTGDGNGGLHVGKALFWLLMTLVAGVGFTTGDLGDFLDGPTKVRRIERIEVELSNLTKRFEEHVEGNIDDRRDASLAVEQRFEDLTKRMDEQTRRLDAIYQILVQQTSNGDR